MASYDTREALLHLPPRGNPPAGAREWAVRAAAAATALVFIAVAAGQLMPPSWWVRAGFEMNPGFFVKKQFVDYVVCQPWRDFSGMATGGGAHWATRTATVAMKAGATANVGLLLPKDAVVDAVYCGSTNPGGSTSECSMSGCDYPAVVSLDDDLYTHGRALSFTLEAKSGAGLHGRLFQLWVKWRHANSVTGTRTTAELEERP
jgi:hypothetical protein